MRATSPNHFLFPGATAALLAAALLAVAIDPSGNRSAKPRRMGFQVAASGKAGGR